MFFFRQRLIEMKQPSGFLQKHLTGPVRMFPPLKKSVPCKNPGDAFSKPNGKVIFTFPHPTQEAPIFLCKDQSDTRSLHLYPGKLSGNYFPPVRFRDWPWCL